MLDLSLDRLLFVVPAIIVALTFHEYAHARVAYAFGDPTAKEAGRMNFNPFRHLDPIGTLLLIFAGFGWAKPVPINPWYFQGNRKKKIMAVSLAGPMMNIVEALVGAGLLSLILHFVTSYSAVWQYFVTLLSYFVMINVVLAVFNLIPIPPLDGSKILGGLLPDRHLNVILSLERYGFGILMLLMLLPTILGLLGLPQIDIFGTIINTPANFLMDIIYKIVGL
ncbi:MAG: site-2 protease family protein [Clostridiales bacterium]